MSLFPSRRHCPRTVRGIFPPRLIPLILYCVKVICDMENYGTEINLIFLFFVNRFI